MYMEESYMQPNNPSNEERYKMLKRALEVLNRPEDLKNIIEMMSPPRDITTILPQGSCKGIKIGIIGAGLAGLSSAFELRKLGFDITIFEMQEKRIGGRIYTHYFDKDEGLYAELGAMRIPVSHETTWHYVNTFDLKTSPFIQSDENTYIYIRHKRAKNDLLGKDVMKKIYPEFNLTPKERVTPWQKLISYVLTTPLLNMSPEIRKEILKVQQEYPLEIDYLDNFSTRKMMEKLGLSEGAIELISGLEPFIGTAYYNSYFEPLQEEYNVENLYRYKIDGGFVNLSNSFYKSLMSKKPREVFNIKEKNLGKITFKTGSTVVALSKHTKDDKVIVEYKQHNKSQERLNQTFDFVICSIPFSSLRNVELFPMFSNEKMQAIKEVNYMCAQKVFFLCNKRFWEEDDIYGGASSTDLPIGKVWYVDQRYNSKVNKDDCHNKKKNKSSDKGVLLASYIAGQDALRLGNLDEKTKIESVKRQVEQVHGLKRGYLDSIVEDVKIIQWEREQGFYGGYCYFMPSQHRLFSYPMITPEYDNRVYFAGEHTSVLHAWCQGALSSGMKAANEIAQYCKFIM